MERGKGSREVIASLLDAEDVVARRSYPEIILSETTVVLVGAKRLRCPNGRALLRSFPPVNIGVFQLLPRGRAATDREVVEQALWEVDFAERHGFESVWVTEHHFSGYGSIGVPSVYAAS